MLKISRDEMYSCMELGHESVCAVDDVSQSLWQHGPGSDRFMKSAGVMRCRIDDFMMKSADRIPLPIGQKLCLLQTVVDDFPREDATESCLRMTLDHVKSELFDILEEIHEAAF